MNTPPLLLGAAVLFWGVQTRLLFLAVPLGLLLEGARLVRWRWEFSRDDFDRLASATSLMAWGIAGYLFVTTDPSRALTTLFQWMPLLLAPLMLAQAYGSADRVDVTGLFWTFRRRRAAAHHGRRRSLNLSYVFLAVCLLSAAGANVRGAWFYLGLCGLAGWALWAFRSRRFAPAIWIALLTLVAGLGYGGHVGLHAAQRVIEAKALEWVSDLLRRDTDPFRSSTAIGSIGTLKLSDRIVLRVEGGESQRPTALLREASYNIYSAPAWLAYDSGFRNIQAEGDGTAWTLGAGPAAASSATVSAYLRRGRGVLALPSGTFQIQRLTAVGISRNPLGAVKVNEGLGLATYQARFSREVDLDEPPGDLDLRVPASEAAALAPIVARLALTARRPAEIRDTVARYFHDGFRYSTFLADRPGGSAPLADFLLRTRAGHCEYFATATVLLMRAAGVPARYATGYAVQEWSALEKRWIVRARHAHSWALVYIDGGWRDLDTTPAAWVDEEAQALASFWQPLSDLGAWVTFVFSRWRWGERGEGLQRYVGWLLIPLILILAWRLYFRRQRTRLTGPSVAAASRRSWTGADSELYVIEERLRVIGLARDPAEPLSEWLRRIETSGIGPGVIDPLRAIVALHSRYRFDPAGLSADEREALRAHARSWLEQNQALPRLT